MTKIKTISKLIGAGILCFSFLAISGSDINEKMISRVLKELSSNEMNGRMIFTPDIEKAAAFIQKEFKKSGLKNFQGNKDYKQSFKIFSLTTKSLHVQLNGKDVEADNIMHIVSNRKIAWKSGDRTEVIHVGADDGFRKIVLGLRSKGASGIVVVDTAHTRIFKAFQRYFSSPRKMSKLGEGPDIVVVLGVQKDVTDYDVRLENDVVELPLANVVGQVEGRRKDEVVIFSAHYDHVGVREAVEGDSIYNGANDNASGTTAVIALANYFAKKKPERTLVFVAFTAEESGGFGSKYFSQQLDPAKIMAMFNIEMIGRPLSAGRKAAFITGYEKSSFGEILTNAVDSTYFEFIPDPTPAENLFYRSDNATLARLGVPAHSLSTTNMETDQKYYHKPQDEFETIDISHMTRTIEAIARSASGIIAGEVTPTRVNVTTLK